MISVLQGKKIILGVTGSIAAYKSVFLCRLLVKTGAEVKVIMTKAATDFVGPLTFSTLSQHPVVTDVSSGDAWNNHVDMGLWADIMLVAPITANSMAKFANGLCDNLLGAVYLSARCPVFIAPAMDLDMWAHPSTLRNLEQLKTDGNKVIPVGSGELASGLSGAGRMAEPEDIVAFLEQTFDAKKSLTGQKIIITAGPTYEAIDPVRFIGNRSSGKMGVAIATEAAQRGAEVHLILGPSAVKVDHPDIQLHRVESSEEMYNEAVLQFSDSDVAILAAAVADYKPTVVAKQKIKKKGDEMVLNLIKTHDIAQNLGQLKKEGQVIVGFALETNEEEHNAKGKIKKKNFDFIILNSLRDKGAGFQHDTNKVTIIDKGNNVKKYQLKSKTQVAVDILDYLEEYLS